MKLVPARFDNCCDECANKISTANITKRKCQECEYEWNYHCWKIPKLCSKCCVENQCRFCLGVFIDMKNPNRISI